MDLATEILQDLKKEAKRKQIVIYVLIGVIVLLMLLNMVERTLWDYSTVLVDAENGDANYIGKDGNIYNGEDPGTSKNTQEETDQQEQNTQD